ncbi:MAG: transposase [bacterium]|nr:transposase [bacterium]
MPESSLDLDRLPPEDLKKLLVQALEENARLGGEVAVLREEIARLKGLPGKPRLKPSGMEKKTDRAEVKRRRRQKRRGAKGLGEKVTERRVITVVVPEEARFKGYQDFVVQELSISRQVILFRRQRWQLPDGSLVVAPMPAGIEGHFGPELKRFVLAQYHRGQTTVERLLALLQDLGIEISKRQVVRLLIDGKQHFVAEADAVLQSGLETASWVSADDTGARHAARNQFCTQIGDDRFAWFATRPSKSRLNFLKLLQAGRCAYKVNAAALDYMRERGLSLTQVAALRRAGEPGFREEAAWQGFAADCGILATNGSAVDPLRIATEGALWGVLSERGLAQDTVFVSDGAGQFAIGSHARCWVHMERQIHALDTFTKHQRLAKEAIRERIWKLYADLKAWRGKPSARRRCELAACFDAIFTSRTGFVTLDRMLTRFHAKRASFLRVLDHPEIPLHTNGSENDIRCQVTRRKLSGGTQSDAGRDVRDAMLSLMKTCRKLKLSFWDYLGNRLGVPGAPSVANLPDLLRQPVPP